MKTTVVVPTYNESENLPELVSRIRSVAPDVTILVADDDSPDKTWELAEQLSCKVLRRQNCRRGLSISVVDALRHVDTEKVIVMDADLQHPPEKLPEIIKLLDEHDFVVASRYILGGDCVEWDFDRKVISRLANYIARPLAPKVHDIVTGFFGFRKSGLPPLDELSGKGFKIMIDLLVRGNWKSVVETPFLFHVRTRGQTKLDADNFKCYFSQLKELYTYKICKLFNREASGHKEKFLRFIAIGGIGMAINFSILYALTDKVGLFYLASAILAIIVASTNNYFLNNAWTFRDKRRRGKQHIRGWLEYQVLSAMGDGIYIGILALLTEVVGMWYMASAVVSLCFIAVFKYSFANNVIWRKEGVSLLRSLLPPLPTLSKTIGFEASHEWDSFYHGTKLQRLWKQAMANAVWEMLPNASNLLDVGCGASPIIGHYDHATGVDLNPFKIDFMRTKLPEHEFKQMEATYLQFPDKSFDHVICIEVLEHLDRPTLAIKEISRVLRQGGDVVLSTPETRGFRGMIWKLCSLFIPYSKDHKVELGKKSLDDYCQALGLYLIGCRYVALCDYMGHYRKVR